MDTENLHPRLCRRSLWLTSSWNKQALSADGAVNACAVVVVVVRLALPRFSLVSKSTSCAPADRHRASAVCGLCRSGGVELVCRWCCRCYHTVDWLPELLSADFLRQTAATTAWWRRAAASARISAEVSSRKGCATGTTRVSSPGTDPPMFWVSVLGFVLSSLPFAVETLTRPWGVNLFDIGFDVNGRWKVSPFI